MPRNHIGIIYFSSDQMFRETKKGGQIDRVLQEYSACIRRCKNAQNGVTGINEISMCRNPLTSSNSYFMQFREARVLLFC